MFGIQVGMDYEILKSEIVEQLKKMPKSVYESAYNAAGRMHDPDHKAAAAAVAALQEILPEIIAMAIVKNNERMVKTLEELEQQRR